MNFGHTQQGTQQQMEGQTPYNQQLPNMNPMQAYATGAQLPIPPNAFNTMYQSQMPGMAPYTSVMGMMPPMSTVPGMPPGPSIQTSYPPGQGPLAGRPVTRAANGLYEAPETEGPEPHGMYKSLYS